LPQAVAASRPARSAESWAHALDDPEPFAARQAGAALEYAQPWIYTRAFVYCANPGCHDNAELDVSYLPDEVTFGELQPRMVCTACDHRGAHVSTSWLKP